MTQNVPREQRDLLGCAIAKASKGLANGGGSTLGCWKFDSQAPNPDSYTPVLLSLSRMGLG